MQPSIDGKPAFFAKIMNELQRLSELIYERNENAKKITALINRPALIGHLGEYIASKIFSIDLEVSAVSKGLDGRFRTGPLIGKSVNVKWYAKREGILDMRQDAIPDYYLVLAGPKTSVLHSRGEVRPWHIESVHLFDAARLIDSLRKKPVKIGIATSVGKKYWDEAEVFPGQSCKDLLIDQEQKRMLEFFNSKVRSG